MLQDADSQIVEVVKEMYKSRKDIHSLKMKLSGCVGNGDRMNAFVDHLVSVGKRCFRYHVGSDADKGGKMAGVCYFDGKIWVQVEEVVFKMALKEYCIKKLGMFSQEWLKGSGMMMGAVKDGCMLNPLDVNSGVVGFTNGVYDFTNVDRVCYHPFSDKMGVTFLLDYEYKVRDSCPLWKSFLDSILDKSQQKLLQMFLGLGMVDRKSMSSKVENSLWLVGPGGTGKSTIMNVVRYVYGDECISGISLGSLLSGGGENRARFLALAAGKVFNYCGEVQMSDMTRCEDAFKSLCSGEPQPIRRIGGNVEMCYDIPYLIFNMNTKPRSNIDTALQRRLLFITFKTVIREEDRDPELETKLKAEASGIRNWMLEGYRMFVKEGCVLRGTELSGEETDDWMIENGKTVQLFMKKNNCSPYADNRGKSSRWLPVKILFNEYEKWCDKWGYELDAQDVNGMGRELRALKYASKRKSSGICYQIYGGDRLVV